MGPASSLSITVAPACTDPAPGDDVKGMSRMQEAHGPVERDLARTYDQALAANPAQGGKLAPRS